MGKTLLAILFASLLTIVVSTAWAQVYRYNPQTGTSENISPPAAPSSQSPTKPQRPTAGKPIPLDVNKMKQAILKEKNQEIRSEDGSSTNDLIDAVNKNINDERINSQRKMLPLGRVGIIINLENYNPTIERNIIELSKIPDLDKLYMSSNQEAGKIFYIWKWTKLSGQEFMKDSRNLVQQKFNIKVPGFAYLRPDGTHTAYSLEDLAPFYEALTVQRRKVGK